MTEAFKVTSVMQAERRSSVTPQSQFLLSRTEHPMSHRSPSLCVCTRKQLEHKEEMSAAHLAARFLRVGGGSTEVVNVVCRG